MMWPFAKYGHCLSELLCAVTAFARACVSTLQHIIGRCLDALNKWAKLSGDCFCSKICMLYSLATGFAAHAVTAIIRN